MKKRDEYQLSRENALQESVSIPEHDKHDIFALDATSMDPARHDDPGPASLGALVNLYRFRGRKGRIHLQGNAFCAFQAVCLVLGATGLVLCICSCLFLGLYQFLLDDFVALFRLFQGL